MESKIVLFLFLAVCAVVFVGIVMEARANHNARRAALKLFKSSALTDFDMEKTRRKVADANRARRIHIEKRRGTV